MPTAYIAPRVGYTPSGAVATSSFDGDEQPLSWLFRQRVMPRLKKSWYADGCMTARELYEGIVERCHSQSPGTAPLHMLAQIARSPEDAAAFVDAAVCVRSAAARFNGTTQPLGTTQLSMAFIRMCIACDAPDALASGLLRANEAGLPMTYRGVHAGLTHWAEQLELSKMQLVLQVMPDAGLPPTTKTAYIAVRAAVNAARLDVAEGYAAFFQGKGVKLNSATQQLLDLARQRHRDRQAAVDAGNVV